MALESSYTAQSAGSASFSASAQSETNGYWPLSKLRRCYTDYLFSKREEIDEQIDARRYYHGSQWTSQQIAALKKRKQPIMTFNRIARKIDGVVGLIEKLRQDPKAFARTPQHADGADLATAAIRYVLDEADWKAKSPQAGQDGAVDGIGGIELEIVDGDKGDKEIDFELVDIQSFFYDPRSYKMDFDDARYMGIGKWLDEDVAKEMFPDADESAFAGNDAELLVSTDRERRWFRTNGVIKQVRIVDVWYKHKGGWCWAIISGNALLMEGKSYFKDEKGKEICKYVMFSGNVDQDGDRYGFIRNMKSAQDGINAKQSKMQHMIASKRIFVTQGGVDDIEKTRTEMMRPDGIVVIPSNDIGKSLKTDDQTFDFTGLDKLLERNLTEIENFGPNPALIGQGLETQSGRAIALLQQAGMAELGPYILAYRGWKIRVYRAIWNAIQQHWAGERWIRVTDDQNLAQYIQVNGLGIGPDGQPAIVNALGSLDVDIILDEGPDTVNSMQDVYETLSNVLPSIAPLMNPMMANNVVSTLIETSPLPSDIKKRFRDQQQQAAQQPPQPDPAVMAAQAKAELDLKSQQASAALENQRNQDANAAKREAAAIDLQHKREAAELDLEMKARQCQMDINHAHQQHSMDMESEARKSDMAVEHERTKASVTLGAKQEEARIRQDEMKAKSEQETKAKETEAKPIKEVASVLEKINTKLDSVIEEMNAPVQIVRDANGRPASVKKGSRTMKVQRGPDGRAQGLQ